MEFKYLRHLEVFTTICGSRTLMKTSERTARDSNGVVWKFDADSLVDVIE